MSEQFVHLHVHTEYSMLDGAAQVSPLFAEAARQGMPAVAQTDHGNMHGAYEFWKAGKAAGVNPIMGIEAYVSPGVPRGHRGAIRWGRPDQKSDDVSAGAYTHLTLLAASDEGLHNLMRMSSLAYLEGQYRKPRMDMDLLAQYGAGIIATTGCPSGEVQTRLRLGQREAAWAAASDLRDIFGDRLYVELMDHGLDIERRVRDDLLALSRDLDIPLVATNDLHYVRQEDSVAHDSLLAVQTGSQLSDPTRFRFDGSGYYLKSAAEMRHLFRELPQACDNTLLIAERCRADFPDAQNLMPRFAVPEGHTESTWLGQEVAAGMARRFPGGVPATHQAQADFELGVINQMGFPGYFLVTGDFISWAKSQGIRVGPGRGSGAGSMVAYALGITDLDPIEHGLIFERFLNPDRVSMPDFDVDFDERRRGEVIDYVTAKYGSDRVSAIGTFGTIKAKAAIKDAARILGYPYAVGDKITKAVPPDQQGHGVTLPNIFDPTHSRYAEGTGFRALHDADHDVATVVTTARGLEGLKRGTGVHAAGIIIGAEPLTDHVPLMLRETDGQVITQFDYPTCENLGLIKFDFLGLSNLTIIDDALANIAANRGVHLTLPHLKADLTDPAVYDLLARGDTVGLFQVAESGMQSLLRMMRPDNFEDISAVGALYRPGPMGANSHTNYALRKNGLQAKDPIHPELAGPLADILDDTHGLIVYQEQVMAIAQRVAGYSLGQADLLRRAMGKKKKEILDKEFVPFRDGMRANGFTDGAVQTLWDVLVPFSDYAFNKAHSAAYGLVTYWTAYLKAHYPAEYMAALLSRCTDDRDKTAVFLRECRRLGIQVLPPSVNESAADYAAVGDTIRFGLLAVRGIGKSVVDSILATRATVGPFADFADFIAKIEPVVCTKAATEALVKAGAFDQMGHPRRALAMIAESAVAQAISAKKAAAAGQDSLFDMLDSADDALGSVAIRVPDVEEWDQRLRLQFERDMLGLYVSGHPLSDIGAALASHADTPVTALLDGSVPEGRLITLAGMISKVERRATARTGEPWAKVTLEDMDASIEVLCFPQTYAKITHLLIEDSLLVITAKVGLNEDNSAKVIASDAHAPVMAADGSKPVIVTVPAAAITADLIAQITEVFAAHAGPATVHLRCAGNPALALTPGAAGPRSVTVPLDQAWTVTPGPGLTGDLKALLGPGCLA